MPAEALLNARLRRVSSVAFTIVMRRLAMNIEVCPLAFSTLAQPVPSPVLEFRQQAADGHRCISTH